MEYSVIVGIIEEFKEYSLKAEETLSKLFNMVSPSVWDEDFSQDFFDTINHLRRSIKNPIYCEYYEIKLLFISGYDNARLLSRLKKLLYNLEEEDYVDFYEKLYKDGAIIKVELEYLNMKKKEMQENIKEMIQKIMENEGKNKILI